MFALCDVALMLCGSLVPKSDVSQGEKICRLSLPTGVKNPEFGKGGFAILAININLRTVGVDDRQSYVPSEELPCPRSIRISAAGFANRTMPFMSATTIPSVSLSISNRYCSSICCRDPRSILSSQHWASREYG